MQILNFPVCINGQHLLEKKDVSGTHQEKNQQIYYFCSNSKGSHQTFYTALIFMCLLVELEIPM